MPMFAAMPKVLLVLATLATLATLTFTEPTTNPTIISNFINRRPSKLPKETQSPGSWYSYRTSSSALPSSTTIVLRRSTTTTTPTTTTTTTTTTRAPSRATHAPWPPRNRVTRRPYQPPLVTQAPLGGSTWATHAPYPPTTKRTPRPKQGYLQMAKQMRKWLGRAMRVVAVVDGRKPAKKVTQAPTTSTTSTTTAATANAVKMPAGQTPPNNVILRLLNSPKVVYETIRKVISRRSSASNAAGGGASSTSGSKPPSYSPTGPPVPNANLLQTIIRTFQHGFSWFTNRHRHRVLAKQRRGDERPLGNPKRVIPSHDGDKSALNRI